jgi:hydroxymethylglutaryl-CoA reductase
MRQRGGGILDIELRDKTNLIDHYFQLHATFGTGDSMGANFINSSEQFSKRSKPKRSFTMPLTNPRKYRCAMSILSNYVPNCTVRAEVSCAVEALADKNIPDPQEFAEKLLRAVRIAEAEPLRAVTHNKGIMNGIDAVVLATETTSGRSKPASTRTQPETGSTQFISC